MKIGTGLRQKINGKIQELEIDIHPHAVEMVVELRNQISAKNHTINELLSVISRQSLEISRLKYHDN